MTRNNLTPHIDLTTGRGARDLMHRDKPATARDSKTWLEPVATDWNGSSTEFLMQRTDLTGIDGTVKDLLLAGF